MTEPAKVDTKPDWLDAFQQACAGLPDQVKIPYAYTPEGQRLEQFRKICPPRFMQKLDRSLLPNPTAFDKVAQWDGSFPGPMAYGVADTAKTRATWSALGRLYVRENRPFAWFPAKRLMTEMHAANETGDLHHFFRRYEPFKVLMVDDLEKLNWQFDSNAELVFAFYDWVYREERACITTSNQGPEWWEEKMGAGVARRLFKDGLKAVKF